MFKKNFISSAGATVKQISPDLVSSVVVTLVAIPLCLGIALACGVPLFAGIISGIIGGIVVGILSQSHISVSGPAAGLVAVIIATLEQLGSFDALLLAIVVAGLLQLLIGVLKAGFVADYVPSNVVGGLLAAVGILIILKQLPFAFGYVANAEIMGLLKDTQQEFFNWKPLFTLFYHINWGATIISLLSLLILIGWPRVKFSGLRSIPAPIVVVVAGVIINFIYSHILPGLYLSRESYLVNLPVIQHFSNLSDLIRLPDFSQWNNLNIYFCAFTIAAVASLETLLNLEAVEKIDKNKRYCSRNREMIAQGVGNMASGLIGGLPITSVIVRSSVNIESGAQSKLSTIFHGFLLLILVLLFPKWMNYIPLASLATILIHTGYKLASVKRFQSMYSMGFSYFFPFIVTTVAIIATDLLIGIIIGLITAIFFILRSNSTRYFDIVKVDYPHETLLHLVLPEQVTFLNKAAFISELNLLPKKSKVVLDGSNIDYIDHDIIEVIKDFAAGRALRDKIALNIIGFDESVALKNDLTFPMATTKELQDKLTPISILTFLKDGNQRFISNRCVHRNFRHQIEATSTSQNPFAVVLGCIDSRVPVEIIFDQGIGDIFCARVAGNVANHDILGSIEFACQVVGAKLILVMGHQECGAIKAACDGIQLGNITELLKKIEPAVQVQTSAEMDRNSNNPVFVEKVTRTNIALVQDYIYQQSTVLHQLISEGKVLMVGGLYDVKSGQVEFQEPYAPPQ